MSLKWVNSDPQSRDSGVAAWQEPTFKRTFTPNQSTGSSGEMTRETPCGDVGHWAQGRGDTASESESNGREESVMKLTVKKKLIRGIILTEAPACGHL